MVLTDGAQTQSCPDSGGACSGTPCPEIAIDAAKAARANEKVSKGDRNPKDFILFPRSKYQVLSTTKDNTGKRAFTEGMVFPTLDFPSDHAIVAATLARRHA